MVGLRGFRATSTKSTAITAMRPPTVVSQTQSGTDTNPPVDSLRVPEVSSAQTDLDDHGPSVPGDRSAVQSRAVVTTPTRRNTPLLVPGQSALQVHDRSTRAVHPGDNPASWP